MYNRVILMGRLTKDPELRTTQSGIAMCRFSIAVDRGYARQGEERQTDFFDVTAWRQTADFVGKYFSKGRMVLIEGSIQNNSYTDQNGVKQYSQAIMAERVQFCGDKSGSASQAQPQTYTATAAPQAQTAVQTHAQKPVELGDFEEILSDGEAPF